MSTELTLPTGTALLAALESMGPRPALAWYGEASRVELSGHVLANWITKSIGHLEAEIALEPGEEVLLDLPPHWKRLVIALAAWSLGARVEAISRDAEGDSGASAPRVLATDRADSPAAETADEVLVLDAASLAPRFSGELPPLAHDWAQEMRGHPDQLGALLPPWSGPSPRPAAGSPRPLLVEQDGLEVVEQTLTALLTGAAVVGPAASLGARALQDEGLES